MYEFYFVSKQPKITLYLFDKFFKFRITFKFVIIVYETVSAKLV